MNNVIFYDEITPNLYRLSPAVFQAAREYFEQKATDVETYAKNHAPWNDITGDARSSLYTRVEVHTQELSMTLNHGVYYGFWLEVRWNGRFAVIEPTIMEMGPQVMEGLRNLFDRVSL